jgi:phosphoglycolate phosphatase
MARFAFDIVGFDLDGTLLDTSADLTSAVNHALTTIGRPPLRVADVVPMIGRGTRHMLDQALQATGGSDAETLERSHAELLRHYAANIARETRCYPGLAEALDALETRGAKLAVVTNKLEALALQLLGALGLDQRFETVIGGDTMGPGNGKPSAAPILEMIRRCGGGRAAFVGDSEHDVAAARNAGIPVVLTAFGFLTRPAEDLKADAVIGHFDALVPALDRLAPA